MLLATETNHSSPLAPTVFEDPGARPSISRRRPICIDLPSYGASRWHSWRGVQIVPRYPVESREEKETPTMRHFLLAELRGAQP